MTIPEEIQKRLLPFQIPAVAHLVKVLQRENFAVDASETGVGKTYIAIAVCTMLDMAPCVICPKSVIPVWQKVLEKFGIVVYGSSPVVNYEQMRSGKHPFYKDGKFILNKDWMIIFDEAHRCKGQKSLNSKLMMAARKQGIKTLALSATLASNPLEMKAVGYGLGLHNNHDFWKWCFRNGCKRNFWGGLIFKGDATVLGKLHQQIFPLKGNRLLRANIPDFPETLVTADSYDIDPEAVNVYENLRYDLAALKDQIEHGDPDCESNPMTVLLRARQEIELLKVPIFKELAEDAIAEGHSVVIFVNFLTTLNAINTVLKEKCSLIYGGQNELERSEELESFQTNKKNIIILTTASGGVGLSLHDLEGGHPRLALISPTYSAIELIQALGRVCRAGGKSKSVQKIIFAAGTVEEDTCKAVRTKLNNLALLNDGDLRTALHI